MTAFYDLESECAVLAAILLHGNDALAAAMSVELEPKHLYEEKHRIVFRAFVALAGSGTPIDALSVKRELQDRNQLDDVGVVYLAGLTEGIPQNIDVGHYANSIVDLASKRSLLSAMANAQAAAGSANGDFPVALEDVKKQLESYFSQANRTGHRNLVGRVREYIEGIEGTFFTQQLCADLGITDSRDKTNLRQILKRMKGSQIRAHGNQAGCWRIVRGDVDPMDLEESEGEDLDLWLPMDLANYVTIMPGNEIIVTGDPDSGKTAFLLRTIQRNIQKWDCHYFNSEMGSRELRKRLDLFGDFPLKHPHFHAYERSDSFEDVIQPGKYVLNVIDYLEITDEFYLISKRLADIYKNLHDSVAIIAIQKRSKNSDLPLGAQRALEKPRLAIALSAGSKSQPNKATILKCKNRKTTHSMIGKSRDYKLIAGCEFRCGSPEWS